MIDAHNHLLDPRLSSPQQRITEMQTAGITHCVVNATQPNEWQNLQHLSRQFPHFITPAYGIHPWKISHAKNNWLNQLREILLENPHATIGEIGLDRWIQPNSIKAQTPIFLAQYHLAIELQRPLTIHCIKAASDLQHICKSNPLPPSTLLHSFQASREILQHFAKKGAYFSLSGYVLHPKKSSWRAALTSIPIEQILLESDAPNMLPPREFLPSNALPNINFPSNLSHFAAHLAPIWNLSTPEFLAQTTQNFHRWLKRKPPTN